MKGEVVVKRKVKPHAQRWGAELRKYRSAVGRTQKQVAKQIQATGTLISGFESGTHWPSRDKVVVIDGFLEADGQLLDLWVRLTNREAYPSFLGELVKAEPLAVLIREFQPLVISGLLQTRSYARSLVRASNRLATSDEVEEVVEARMKRQRLWEAPRPPKMLSVINEAVLLAPTGGVAVMVEQLDRLVEMVESHRVGLQIVPLSTSFHPGHTGMVVLLGFENQPEALYMEDALSGSMRHGPEVDEARTLFGELQGVAWSPEVSLERLRAIRKGFLDGTYEGLA
jgi:transcriptional regulator with XRE-family HTH domain